MGVHRVWIAALAMTWLVGCPSDEPAPPADDDTTEDVEEGPFAQYCGSQPWDAELTEATVNELEGSYLGVYNTMPEGTVSSQKIIPRHPFQVLAIRAAYAGDPGPIRIRLTDTWGRSYPDVDGAEGGDLIEPIELDLDDADADEWIEIDISHEELFLMPTQHYALVDERLGDPDGPFLAVETVPEGGYSSALMLVPGESMGYGSEGNFRLQLTGNYFCEWEDDEWWFGKDEDQPFHDVSSSRVAVSDLDGDGIDDVVIHAGGPLAYLGDGEGGFTEPTTDPFPEDASEFGMVVFGDVDNDGDQDVFAASYVGADDDGDGWTKAEGDCNDADEDIRPSEAEQVSNGIDDNCDGLTDGGLDTSDADGDGITVADGDCHDHDPAVHPLADEVLGNYRDDDCDGVADDGSDVSDQDGDGASILYGDCDDTDPAIYPTRTDGADNGIDDDCDGIVDGGTSEVDSDGDGYTVAEGDCDDSRPELFPGADEQRDGMDNDCDGEVDEDFGNRIWLNDGDGRFEVLEAAGVEAVDPSTAGGFGDADGDGNLDLYYGNWLEHYPADPAVQDRFFYGNGDGTFTDGREEAGLTLPTPWSCYGVMWNDYNDDGWPDIFVGNYHLYDNQLWTNQGDGTFADQALQCGVAHDEIEGPYAQWPGGHTYGGDFGDIDNDGDLDAFFCNLAHPRVQPWSDPSMFVVSQGPPDYGFDNLLYDYGFIYDEGDVNAQFADIDNDMDLDLAIASLYTGHYSRLYRNDGADGFTDVTYETGTAVHNAVSVTWSDVDRDGDLDLLQADREGGPWVHLFVNRVGQDRHWIELDLVGSGSNRDAVGAKVTVSAGGVTQQRHVKGGEGHSNTQSSHWLHFGLGEHETIDEVTVRWVGGATEGIDGIAVDGRYRVEEGSGAATEVE